MLGSNQECMTTHEEMADCSQVLGDGDTSTELDSDVHRTTVPQTDSEHKQHPQQEIGRRMLGRRTPVARRRRTPVARRRRTPSSRRRRTRPKFKCSQPKLPPLKCPPEFMAVANSFMNIDKTKNGVRLLARTVSCKCTLMPPNAQAILKEASKCSVAVYKQQHHKGKIRTLVTSNPNGVIFTNNVELGEEEEVGLDWGSRRRRTDKDWGSHILSSKLEGACANVEYVGASSTLGYADVLSVGASDDDGKCSFNKDGCLSRCVRRLGEFCVLCR